MIQHWVKYTDHQYFGDWGLVNTFTASADITAPVLSNPTGTATGSTTATGTVDTDEGNGTLYYLATTNASELASTIKLGSSQAVTTTGTQNVSLTGLIASTTYYLHFVHDDNALNESNVVSSSAFTTDAAAQPGSSGGYYGRGIHWTPSPDKPKSTVKKWDDKKEKELQRLLKEAIEKENQAKEARRIAKNLEDNVNAVSDIHLAARKVESEIQQLMARHKITEEKARVKLRKLRDEEDLIIAILLSDL